MTVPDFPFQTFDWTNIPEEHHRGETGYAIWQIIQVGSMRIRKVVYSPSYIADHWCSKGHVIQCLDGAMITELQDGRQIPLEKGMTYIVGDGNETHRTQSKNGCTLFIVD